ncbi:MAG TPA: preprotein translocase subunit SecY [bacterium]|nr:preprotein translocase subunit SecY [bacterium]HPA56029.1 preprotein translocase subunit SecY [bacterium]HPG36571.1 preprotein translocase subunit SecY [bacterium]HPM46752.1 preprotein translocase subunit SecY [bacterium]HQI04097.1 preprotein translocase subunit SecY [bacterium]
MISKVLKNIFKIPDLRERVIFTLLMLAVYRLGIFVTTPGVNRSVMEKIMSTKATGTLLGLFNMFSGGAVENLSIFALGIMPYISASIVMSLLAVIVPKIGELQKEGDQGYRKITQYTRYGTVLLCVVQGFMMAKFLESLTGPVGEVVVNVPGWFFRIITVITLTAGTLFLMWLGEQITDRGIGNGVSLIIFASIVARFPNMFFQMGKYLKEQLIQPHQLVIFLIILVATFAIIVFVESSQRRIPVQYARRVAGGRKIQNSHLPLRINTSGVIPPIFASALLVFPATLSSFLKFDMGPLQGWLNPGGWLYNLLYLGLIVFFCFFYTFIQFKTEDVAENINKQGGYIPGVRPGKETVTYINTVLSRITFGGAIYLSAVCMIPDLLRNKMGLPFYMGGTSILIVVGVAMDMASQIESYLINNNYEGFSIGGKGSLVKSRRG